MAPDKADPNLVHGCYLFSLEKRTLNDVRALEGNDAEDDLRFATAARLSEVNQGLYRTFLQPAVRSVATPQSAELMRQMHPDRLEFSLFSDRNPLIAALRPRTARLPLCQSGQPAARGRASRVGLDCDQPEGLG